jgi:hypothetical protein
MKKLARHTKAGPDVFVQTTEPRHRAPRVMGTDTFVCHLLMETYAVKEVPQPQLPVAFGFVKVKPEPMTPVT